MPLSQGLPKDLCGGGHLLVLRGHSGYHAELLWDAHGLPVNCAGQMYAFHPMYQFNVVVRLCH